MRLAMSDQVRASSRVVAAAYVGATYVATSASAGDLPLNEASATLAPPVDDCQPTGGRLIRPGARLATLLRNTSSSRKPNTMVAPPVQCVCLSAQSAGQQGREPPS